MVIFGTMWRKERFVTVFTANRLVALMVLGENWIGMRVYEDAVILEKPLSHFRLTHFSTHLCGPFLMREP